MSPDRSATPAEAAQATKRLVQLDPAFARVVAECPPWQPAPARRRPTTFAALASSICHQQLAGAAARTIHGRFLDLVDRRPTPAKVCALDPDQLRQAGLSGAKAASILDLAHRCQAGEVRLGSLARRSDEAVVAELTTVRGIGPWTAQMLLLFHLGRLDVWPSTDLGVQVGWGLLHDEPRPSPAALERAGTPLVGVRSVAAWYCWRAVDLHRQPEPPDGAGAR